MDSRWFKEDRKLPKGEQAKAIEESKKALQNSTFLSRRLKAILEEEVEKTYSNEEDYMGPGWKRKILANANRRWTLQEIIKLLP